MADRRREKMVRRTVEGRGVRDPRVLEAMRTVPRERFVQADQDRAAYDDRPLPIGSGQTISQPYIVALMAEAAAPRETDTVLEIGTGSGYGAAVLAQLAGRVVTLERHADLAEAAGAVLRDLSIDNVEVVVGDGTRGWPPEAPYDAIVVTAAARVIPPALPAQLVDGGRLVIPVGARTGSQKLLCLLRRGEELQELDLGPVAFVPLVADPAD